MGQHLSQHWVNPRCFLGLGRKRLNIHVLIYILAHCDISRRLLSRILFIWPLGPFRDVSVAIVIRRGWALCIISEMLSQLTFSMRSGMVLFHGNTDCVVLTIGRERGMNYSVIKSKL